MTIAVSPSVPGRRAVAPEGSVRYHALDHLRAFMLLLGIALHAALSYTHMPRNAIWPFKDARSSVLCDAIMFASGLFRMPAFFLVAGFFAALIHQRRGIRGLVLDRARRILVPFFVCWLLAFPFVRAGFDYADALALQTPEPAAAAARSLRDDGLYAHAYPMHLWFLEYLLIYYLAAVLIAAPLRRLGDESRFVFFARLPGLMRSPWRPLWLAAMTALPLLGAPMGLIPTPLTFLPEPVSLAAHGIFFAAGWALCYHVELLPELGRRAGRQVTLAVLLLPLCGLMLRFRSLVLPAGAFGALPPGAEGSLSMDPAQALGLSQRWIWPLGLCAQLVLAICCSLAIWLLVLGVTGLFLRWFQRPNHTIRYLADASYWLYLVHFPLMVWTPMLLAPLQAPALIKLTLVLTITMSVMLASYELLVRRTPLLAFVGAGSQQRTP